MSSDTAIENGAYVAAPPGFPELGDTGASYEATAPVVRAPAVRRILRALVRHPGLVLAGLFLLFLVVAAVAPSHLAPYDPLEADARSAFLEPDAAHWLGTDENGRDVLSRLIHGVRPSLVIGVAATVIGLALGVTLGLVAALSPRWADALAMRFADVLLAFPDILLALVIISFWSKGVVGAVVAIGVAGIPRYARLVRAQAKLVRSSLYVEAATTLGLSRTSVILRHVLPNAVKPALLLAVIGIGGKIGAGATLSFLGLGEPPPAPEWGSMLAVGRNYLANAPWLVAAPAVAVTLAVVAFTALGRVLLRNAEGRKV